jgi:glycosyltransferase involved in cell wall biosynthesis
VLTSVNNVTSASALPPVLILGDHLGYEAGVVHGVTIYFLNVMPALKQAGLRFTVCFLREFHPAAQRLVDAGVAPLFLSAARMNPLVTFKIAALVRRQHIRIIHASGFKGTLIARIVGRLTGARVIIHLHDLFYPGVLMRGLHWLFSNASDTGLCVAAAARQAAINGYFITPVRVVVAHSGIELAPFQNVDDRARARIRHELSIPAEAPVLGLIGRFFPVKGHRGMVQVMARIVEKRADAVLIFAGDGPERAACEALCAQLDLRANVRFAGQRADVPELLSALDIVVVPSILEGLGLAGIEALAAGRPIVSYDVGGMREIVTDGVDGRVIEPANQQAFAQAVLELLGDPERLRQFGMRARQNSRQFGVDQHVQKLIRCYSGVAA